MRTSAGYSPSTTFCDMLDINPEYMRTGGCAKWKDKRLDADLRARRAAALILEAGARRGKEAALAAGRTLPHRRR